VKDITDTFQEKVYECNRHKEKILDAKEYLNEIFPLTLERYLTLGKIEYSFIDQLNFRFSKLQDTMGENLFKSILILAKEDVKRKTFLDILNRLEELELVEKNEWLRLREIRNESAHEYSFNQQEVVDSLNLIYDKSAELIIIYDRVVRFANTLTEKYRL